MLKHPIIKQITATAVSSESRYFCRKIFSGILLEKIGKNYATAYAFGAPIRPRHLVSTQQGVDFIFAKGT